MVVNLLPSRQDCPCFIEMVFCKVEMMFVASQMDTVWSDIVIWLGLNWISRLVLSFLFDSNSFQETVLTVG